MEIVRCQCMSCHVILVAFFNVWVQIRKTYFSPTTEATGDVNLKVKEPVRSGEPQTQLASTSRQAFVVFLEEAANRHSSE